ncbi:MAG: hypothetical protein JW850_15105 [Thermoflexales bacterium]|nr:hypothetical protein [Thermoflexales bacterium]
MKRAWFKTIALASWVVVSLTTPAWVRADTAHPSPAHARQPQDTELRLSLSKRFGFALGGQIQGSFELSVRGPDELASVTYQINDPAGSAGPSVLGEVETPPFALTFSTDKYPQGHYELSAVGQTAGGQQLESNVLRVEFVSAEAGWQTAGKIILPIAVLIGVLMLASFIGPLLMDGGQKKRPVWAEGFTPGEPRDYGLLGGAVCPKCGRPFGRHCWGLNLSFTGKLDRCPHCGKWSLVRRASREELAAAEAAEAGTGAVREPPSLSPEEKLRRQVEDSRYTS